MTCVSAGEMHSACCTSDGDLYTWGEGFCGQLGHGDKRPQLLPKRVEGDLEYECVERCEACVSQSYELRRRFIASQGSRWEVVSMALETMLDFEVKSSRTEASARSSMCPKIGLPSLSFRDPPLAALAPSCMESLLPTPTPFLTL